MPPKDLQDVINILTKTPKSVADLVKDLCAPDLRAKNSPQEFSVLENVCHLRDIEIEGYTARISRILTTLSSCLPFEGGRDCELVEFR